MLIHVDGIGHAAKPAGKEIAIIKNWFTDSRSIQDMSVEQIAEALAQGGTVQPGVTPFSAASRERAAREGKTNPGTVADDFTRQTLFMNDIDNKADAPKETPAHVAEELARHGLKAAFMYDTFSSSAECEKFRYAVVCSEEITDKGERDRIQLGIIHMSPQSDTSCTNADRIFFGTDKGLLDEYTDFTAVCSKEALLALADVYAPAEAQSGTKAKTGPKFGDTIPTGKRHETLVSFASTVLKKYGIGEQAHAAFMERAAQCEEPKPDDEVAKIWRDACGFFRGTIAAQPGYMLPGEYAARDFSESLEPLDYTDVGQATVFAAVYGDQVRYSPETGFIVYTGTVWKESDVKAQGLLQELTGRQLEEARSRVRKAQDALNAAVESGDAAEAKEALKREETFRKFVLDQRKGNRPESALKKARPMLEIDVAQLDADGFLLNTPTGTIDLRTGDVRPHNPDDFCTKITGASPDDQNAELFTEFMERVTCGDTALEEYLQTVAGMCAVGVVKTECLIIAYGEGGNGKSTLFNLLARVLGDYSDTLSAEVLTVNCRRNKSPEFATLRGKRLVIAAELEEGQRLDTAVVKQLCSTDEVRAEEKFKSPFSFRPSHTIILYTNHLPKVGTFDKGTWSRIAVVPFRASFRGMQGEIKDYAGYMYERCAGAVLAWIVEGAKRFIANDCMLAAPECVERSVSQYREDNNWVDHFLTECCEIGTMYTARSGELYARYKQHCDNTGEYRRSLPDLKSALDAAGYQTRKTRTGAVVFGLRLVPDFVEVHDQTPWD